MERRVRFVEERDAEAIRDIYAPFVSGSATSFEIDPPDAPAMEQRIRELRGQYPWLVFENGKQVLGYAYASSHRTRRAYQWCVEVSVYVHAAARQYGVGRALYRALFEILRRQGYVNAYAGITLPNPASMGLHESLGFLPVGVFSRIGFKFGQWHDVAWLQLRLLEASEPVANPDPAPKFFLDETVAAILRREAETIRL
jgi:L-amino acid N-acyltransferase YncA